MKVVTLRGTYDIDLARMKILDRQTLIEHDLKVVPTVIVGQRLELVTEDGEASTAPVVEVEGL